MKKLCVLSVLFVFLFSGAALAQKGTFVAPSAQAPAAELTLGKWTPFDFGQYIVARDNDSVLIVSTWDELTEQPDQILDWRRGGFKKEAPAVAGKLVTKLMDTPGVVNVIVAKHRVEIYRANVYTWDILLPRVLEIFATGELRKGP